MTLTKLPGSKWWIETDDKTGEIIGTYNKANIIADIQSIDMTLERYPSPSKDALDVAEVLNSVSKYAAVKSARITELVNKMYQAYQGDPLNREAAQLISKREELIALRNRLV